LTDFRNFFTAIYNNELRNKNLLKFSPHLKSVAALPCETCVAALQGSVATDLRWGENFNTFLFRNSLLYIAVKKLRKSVNICLSYQKMKVSRFLWPTV